MVKAKKKQEIIKSKCPQCDGSGEIERKKVNGKKKGNRGELKVCKILTESIGIGKFNRVPSSGAFGTTHVLSEEAQRCLSGDLIAPVPNFAFSIENKCGYNDIEIGKGLMNEPQIKQVREFIDQSCEDAIRTERFPMVIYTKDYRDPIVIIPRYALDDSRQKMLDDLLMKINSYMVFNHEVEKNKEWNKWVVMSLENVLNNVKKEFFLKQEIYLCHLENILTMI